MPYILSPLIKENMQGMWGEGAPYSKEIIYKLTEGGLPPVNYDKHIIKSHSLPHIESSRHISNNGKCTHEFFSTNHYFGSCRVIRFQGDNFKELNDGVFHWEISLDELQEKLNNNIPNKLLITIDNYKKNKDGFHDPNYVLTLSQEAATWLTSSTNFNLFGTSWKSTDYKPGSSERPIHSTIFSQAVILECIDLEKVPEGEYFINCFPLRIDNASEVPVTPVLFTKDEVLNCF